MNVHSIVNLTSLIIHSLLGLLAIIKSVKSRLNQIFFLMAISIAISNYGYLIMLTNPNHLFWLRFALSFNCLAGANIVIFSNIYGRANYKELLSHRKAYFIALYVISILLIIGLSYGILKFEFVNEDPYYGLIFSRSGSIFVVFLMLCVLIALVNLESTYRQAKQDKRIKYPAIMFIGALSFHVLIYSMGLGYPYIRMDIHSVAIISIIIANLFLAYPVIAPGHIEAKIYVDRGIIGKSYILLLVGIYLIVMGLLGKIVQIIGKNINFFVAFISVFLIILILMAIILSRSLKVRFHLFISRYFYKSKYDYRSEWEKFSRNVFSVLEMKELLKRVLETISETVGAQSAYMMLIDENRREFFVVNADKNDSLHADHDFFDWLWRYGSSVKIEDHKIKAIKTFSDPPSAPDMILKEDGICIPIIAENKLIAVIVLNDIESISQEDMDLMETMSNQISIAIMNSWRSRELAIAKELESFSRLSSMVLHDLKSSVSMLSLVVQNAAENFDNPEFQKDALKTISGVVNRIQRLILKFSHDIELQNPQPSDLNEIVESAIIESGVKNLSRINFIEELNPLPMVIVDPENIERVILNLIINAVESIADNGTIKVTTSVNSDNLALISISDTGCGMSQDFIRYRLFQPFQTTKSKGIGIGLYQCKMIINAYGGNIDVESKQGVGSTFTVKLPIQGSINQ